MTFNNYKPEEVSGPLHPVDGFIVQPITSAAAHTNLCTYGITTTANVS